MKRMAWRLTLGRISTVMVDRDLVNGVTDEMIDRVIARLELPGEDLLAAIAGLLCVGQRAVPQLIEALPNSWEVVRLRIVFLLGESLDKRAIEPLTELAQIGSYPLRRQALHALRKIRLHHGLVSAGELEVEPDDEMLKE